MDRLASGNVEKTLQKPDVHQRWISSYKTAENKGFYEEAFDYISRVINAPKNATILDAGCGSGDYSVRLVKRGFFVLAIDISENVLEIAEQKYKTAGLTDKIKLQRENILSLSFPDRTFDYILCWGVLMHIPDVEKAISELDRVLKQGGLLVISEGNMFSIQSIFQGIIKLFTRREKATVVKNAAGLEYWKLTPNGELMTRNANIGWLKERFVSKGYTIKKHVSGQFTEMYTKVSSPLLRKCIHGFNLFWFKYVKIPYLAYGNILILQKRAVVK